MQAILALIKISNQPQKINIVSHERCSLTNENKSKGFSRPISNDLEKSSLLKQVSEFMSPHRLYNASLSPTVNASQQICPCLHITTSQPTTFYAKCQMSGYAFLIDTGACRSFVPRPTKTFHLQPYIGPVISTADGQPLKIDGCINIDFIIQGSKYKWEFVVANVAVPILGADFLAAHKLAVDMAN